MRLSETIWAHLLYVVAVVAFAVALSAESYRMIGGGVIGAFGILAIWRYGWGLVHFIWTLVYKLKVFPRMRASADAVIARDAPGSYLLVTTFRIDSVVPRDLIRRYAGFFLQDPQIGALTMDEMSEVRGRRIFQEWYALRYAQRMAQSGNPFLSRSIRSRDLGSESRLRRLVPA